MSEQYPYETGLSGNLYGSRSTSFERRSVELIAQRKHIDLDDYCSMSYGRPLAELRERELAHLWRVLASEPEPLPSEVQADSPNECSCGMLVIARDGKLLTWPQGFVHTHQSTAEAPSVDPQGVVAEPPPPPTRPAPPEEPEPEIDPPKKRRVRREGIEVE